MKTISAIHSVDKQKSFNTNYRKEEHFTGSFAVIDLNQTPSALDLEAAVELRIYQTNLVTYACFWTRHNIFASGTGRAGGCGYHKPSSASQDAMHNAGFSLSIDIDGVGDSGIYEAMAGIARLIGLTNFGIFQSRP